MHVRFMVKDDREGIGTFIFFIRHGEQEVIGRGLGVLSFSCSCSCSCSCSWSVSIVSIVGFSLECLVLIGMVVVVGDTGKRCEAIIELCAVS
ncbi:hypothetical protein BJX99DRAFT_228270 [Aspergillus californicus]